LWVNDLARGQFALLQAPAGFQRIQVGRKAEPLILGECGQILAAFCAEPMVGGNDDVQSFRTQADLFQPASSSAK